MPAAPIAGGTTAIGRATAEPLPARRYQGAATDSESLARAQSASDAAGCITGQDITGAGGHGPGA
ncbi:hypothetical protein [Streptomyces sp. NPDC059788]|uniref:hypothetical protein n=1 Tax=Streptomyces sp. NPDC059788 TaxID=3346948 RepID=UPI003664E237